MPFQGRRIKGFDLLADYLWPGPSPEPSVREIIPDSLLDSDAVTASMTPTETVLDAPEAVDTHLIETIKPQTEFMLFLGDFIYADVPLYFGDDVEAYRRLYRRNYQSASFRKVYQQLRMSSGICTWIDDADFCVVLSHLSYLR